MSNMELAIKLRADGGAKIAQQVGSLGKHFKSLSNELNKTNAVAGKIKNLFDLNRQFAKNAQHIAKSKTELAALRKEIKATDNPSKKLLQTYKKNEQQLGRLVNAQIKEKTQLNTLGAALKKAGIDTKNLRKENDKYAQSVAKATTRLAKFSAKQKDIQANKSQKLQNAANFGFVGAGMLATGRTLGRAINSPIQKIKQVEKSKGELQSIMSKEGAQKIVEQGRETSKRIAGVSTAIFTGAAYTIKSSMSGLSDDAVANMTTAAAITAKATKSDLATMTSLYSKGAGVFKDNLFKEMSDSKFGDMFGSAIAATVQNFDTTGERMASAIRSAGSAASLQGISMSEQLAVLGALQKTMSAEQSGTGYMALTRDPARAQERLIKEGYDVSLLDENNNIKSMPALIESLREVFGAELDAVESGALSAAFGDEGKKVILNLWNSADLVKKETANIKNQSANGIQFAQNMMDRLQDNFSDKMDIQGQRWQAIQEQIGAALIPMLESMMPHLEQFATWVSDFIKNNKGITGTVAAVIAGLGLFLAAGGGVVIAFASLTGAAVTATAALRMMSLNSKIGGIGGIGGVAGGVKKAGFGATLAANAKGGWWKGLGKFGKITAGLTTAISAYQLQDVWRDDTKTRGEALDKTTEVAGGLGGMWAGGAAGAAIGSFVPFIGTAIGGVIGAGLGAYYGSELGDTVGELWKSDDKSTSKTTNTQQAKAAVAAAALATNIAVANTPKVQQITVPKIIIQASANPADTAKAVQAAIAGIGQKADVTFDEGDI